jgi:branched-chain amino acid transport system ATP-binding protein
MLRELKGEVTILLVEHDMETVFSLADRITVLVEGRVIACGAPAAIRANPEVQRAYLGDQGVAG